MKGKPKANVDTTDNMQVDRTEIEVTNYEYLGQTLAMENRTRQEVSIRMKLGQGVFLESTEKSFSALWVRHRIDPLPCHACRKSRLRTNSPGG